MQYLKSLILSIFLVLMTSAGMTMMTPGVAAACGDGSCPPEPPVVDPKPSPKPAHDGRDVSCPAQSDEVAVLKKLRGKLVAGADVTVRNGDRTVIELGGDHEVVKVLSSQRVCVKKERTTVTKVAPAAEKRECNAPTGHVCPDLYEEKYSTPTS